MTPSAGEPHAGAPNVALPGGGLSDEMAPDTADTPASAEERDPAEELRERARRRRRIDEIFGDVLPDVTNDERAPGHRRGFTRTHYEASKPPHWG